MITLTNSEVRVLEALTRYRFVNTAQMIEMGIYASVQNASRGLKNLREASRPLVKRIQFGITRQGRAPDLYYVTPHGAAALAEGHGHDLDSARVPTMRGTLFFSDVWHRVHTVDFAILFDAWCAAQSIEPEDIGFYFDKVGSQRGTEKLRAKTKIDLGADWIIPDGHFFFRYQGKPELLLLEVYEGHDTKRAVEQLEKHLVAINEGTPSIKFGIERAHRLAVVLEGPNQLTSIIKRLAGHPVFPKYKDLFIFSTIAALKENFGSHWVDLHGQHVPFV